MFENEDKGTERHQMEKTTKEELTIETKKLKMRED
jgi:hypothetical protein